MAGSGLDKPDGCESEIHGRIKRLYFVDMVNMVVSTIGLAHILQIPFLYAQPALYCTVVNAACSIGIRTRES